MTRLLSFVFSLVSTVTVYAQDTVRVSLLFAGDVMGHDSQIASAYDAKTNTYDYSSCFQFIKPYIEAADIAIANLEVTLAGPPYKGYPQFSSPDQLAKTLKNAGFDALVTSNNHCVDRGKKGLERTIDVLTDLKIPHTGTFKDSASRAAKYPLFLHKNGFTIALLNYTYGTNGLPVHKPNIVNTIDTSVIRKDLVKAKESNPDAIIVFTHWGAEYQSLPSKWQKDITEFCFKHGATLVIGAHPHVIQPMEWRKDKNQFVAYSLGNFVSGQRKRYTDGGSLAYVELEKVIHGPDSSATRIDSAAYYLQWVHRTVDANKDYYILVAPDGDTKNLGFIKDQASKDAYKLFLSDSRLLSDKYNKNVKEIRTSPAKSEIRYRLLLLTTTGNDDPWKILTSQNAYTWGVDRDERSDGKVYWTSGNFRTREEAMRYRDKYLSQHKDARVIVYTGGQVVE
jgi:poly-gamma-glutamate capsule biosynthesis protein CapA/YwtB (metallophosphatase superfamily)